MSANRPASPSGTTDAVSPWQTLAGRPVPLLGSALPWRCLAYLLTGWPVATLWVAGVVVLMVVPALGLGVLLAGIPLAAVERRRLRLVDPAPAPSPHTPPATPGLWGWLARRFHEAATWKELGYALLFSVGMAWLDAAVGLLVACVGYLIAFPAVVQLLPAYQPEAIFGIIPAQVPQAYIVTALGLMILPIALYLITAYAAGRANLTRLLLARRADENVGAEVVELTRSRARIMDAMDAQRRRIERDLHDGAQQRLTGLVMTLGMARLHLTETPVPAHDLINKAYGEAKTALTELRELVHGIHPQILSNRGLAPAVSELADRCPVPATVDIDLPHRPPEPVEAAAWFVISEALTNIAKHSNARQAWVSARRHSDALIVEVGDDGNGGADPSHGTGLAGLADRVSVLGGRLTLTSPAGGPTLLRVELPCES